MGNNSEIKILSDLPINHNDLLAWTREDSFPIKQISNEDKKRIKDIVSIFVSFEGNQGKEFLINGENIYEELYSRYNHFIDKFISQFPTPSYFIYTEHSPEVKNRIRSYKGILPKEIKSGSSFIEMEVTVDENKTMIVAMVELTNKNSLYLIDNLLNNYTSCIFNSFKKDIFSEEFVSSFPKKYMTLSGSSTINFLSLILDLCFDKRIICRVGGDGGDEELSFQIFCKEDIKDLTFIQAEKALEL